MRRMNYDRFAKPTNFGEWNSQQSKFVLDKPLEYGLYKCDLALDDGEVTHIIFELLINQYKGVGEFSQSFIYIGGDLTIVLYDNFNQVITLDGTISPYESAILYLYKLD